MGSLGAMREMTSSHTTEVDGRISEGDIVEFEIGDSDKGPNAINVRKIGESEEE